MLLESAKLKDLQTNCEATSQTAEIQSSHDHEFVITRSLFFNHVNETNGAWNGLNKTISKRSIVKTLWTLRSSQKLILILSNLSTVVTLGAGKRCQHSSRGVMLYSFCIFSGVQDFNLQKLLLLQVLYLVCSLHFVPGLQSAFQSLPGSLKEMEDNSGHFPG